MIDMHCDTLMKLWMDRERTWDLRHSDCDVDLEKLSASGYRAQFFAAFIYKELYPEETWVNDGFAQAKQMIRILEEEAKKHADLLCKVCSYEELVQANEQGKIGAVQTIEESGIIGDDLGRIRELYDLGVRVMTLLWNYENSLGFPNSDDPAVMGRGLKPLGIEAVEYMNDLGILIDVSHMSDGGFYDVARHSRKPFVASHSNARALCPHRRNLTDDMLRVLAKHGGVAGINFYPAFLGDGGSAESMVRHIRHMEQVAGIDVIAIGTDFDGFDGHAQIADASQMGMLCEALEKAGYKESQLEKILYQNAERVIRDVL